MDQFWTIDVKDRKKNTQAETMIIDEADELLKQVKVDEAGYSASEVEGL